MSKKQDNLSQEEIWDDSALIDSWNEALNEYKKYHSIHAKGGSLRDLESQKQTTGKAESESEQPQAKETDDTELNLKAAEENKETPSSHSEAKGPAVPQGLPSFPIQTVLGSVQDENIKKLLMSWYYAGYYTGLYEGGQQQTQQNHGS
ncbi:hypothetical protein DER45DRAFT_619620 [Fusarium avenaceum]|nr:hypothetical protein DER45DRAFT_619620 [Fusarium avenaceum]